MHFICLTPYGCCSADLQGQRKASMIVDKPPWVTHGGSQIFSVDVHPSGKRFVTAGGDHKIKVWGLAPITNAEAEQDESQPKLLATLADHFGPVNVARFSSDGMFVASGSDDHLVCINELKPGQGAAMFGSDDEPNHENWRQAMSCRGHKSNVMDLTWSPDCGMIASCSLDNTVIVWDTSTGGRLAALMAHSSCVKGVAWDPIGSYLATQGDDKSVIIWKTEDWSHVKRIQNCFVDSTASTFSLRPCWTRDGTSLFAPNVNEPPCQCAAAIERGKWTSDIKLVGHKAPVVACAANPKFFYPVSSGKENGESSPSEKNACHCVALGSQDKRLSVWLTAKSQPVLIAKTVFEAGVNDLAWSPDGYTLLAASIDGTIAVFTFTPEELGLCVSEDQVEDLLVSLYGGLPGGRRATKFVESVAQLQLETALRESGAEALGSSPLGSAAPPALCQPPQLSPGQPIRSVSTNRPVSDTAAQQIESRTKDGRRRVAPIPVSASPASTPATAPRFAARTAAPPSTGRLVAAEATAPQRPPAGAPEAQWQAPLPLAEPGCSGLQPAVVRPVVEVDLPCFGGRLQSREHSQSELASAKDRNATPATRYITAMNKKSGHAAATLACSVQQGSPAATVTGKPRVEWTLPLSSVCLLMAAGDEFIAVACKDCSLQVFSHQGRHLLPPMALPMSPGLLRASGSTLTVACSTTVMQWDVRKQELLVEADVKPVFSMAGSGRTIVELDLSPKGEPVVILSNRHAFLYHLGMRSWMRVADDRFPASSFHSQALVGSPRGALASLGRGAASSGAQRVAAALARGSQQAKQEAQFHLDSSLVAAVALGDAAGYQRTLRLLCKHLAEAGAEGRLREICQELLGPVELVGDCENDSSECDQTGHNTSRTGDLPTWEPKVVGLSRHQLLREVLPSISATRTVPGLVGEFQDMLAELDSGRARLPAASTRVRQSALGKRSADSAQLPGPK